MTGYTFTDADYMPATGMSRIDWLAQRRLGIGGSDASIIMGFNRYTTIRELWLEKRSTETPVDTSPSEAADWGHALEPLVADRLEQELQSKVDEGLWLKPPHATLQNISRPYMLANLDRIVLHDDHGTDPVGIAEIKTVGLRSAGDWPDTEDGIAPAAMWQGIHYMHVTGADVCYYGALVGGQQFRFRTLRRDDVRDLEEALVEACDEFWECVVEGKEPPLAVGFSTTSARDLKERFPEAIPGESVEVEPESTVAEAVREYAKAAYAERLVKRAKDEAKYVIAKHIGDAEAVTVGGEVIATYKSTTRTDLDRTALKADMPEVYEKFAKTNIVRTINVPKGKTA